MEENRKFMRKGEKITLCEEPRNNGTTNNRTFTIISKDGVGASSVSYKASYGSKTGRLKEFYPCEYNYGHFLSIARKSNNQLYRTNETHEAAKMFDQMLEEYIEAYHTLETAKNNAAKGNNSFNTFIPTFEIYRGCDEDGNVSGSAYIWTPDNDGDFETFDVIVKKIKQHPTKNPTLSVYTILDTVQMLTECIKTLHIAGLLHSDIKPSNFGLPIRNGRYLSQHVSLFDVNSIYSVFTKFPKFTGTVGFCAPEVFKGQITNQSDLYSIGATLFNAIITDEKVKDGLYSNEYYDDIESLVASSKILNANPVTAGYEFQYKICNILKKCLAKNLKKRIASCEELISYIAEAKCYLLPAEFNSYLEPGKEIEIINRELESYDEADSMFAMQSLLINHPIYNTQEDTMKILVLGCGVYGQQFIDLCLQAGQMIDKKLEVKIVTHDVEKYKKQYLERRPALKEFFEIDGEGDTSENSYGKLFFLSPADFGSKFESGFNKNTNINEELFIKIANVKKNQAHNKELVQEIVLNECDSNYIFVALGEDELNKQVAKSCYNVVKELSLDSFIAFIYSKELKKNETNEKLKSVNIKAKASENSNYEEIERMAFNAHLTWCSPLKLNADIKTLKKDFKDKYNHDSSVASVLSIKYKLHSLRDLFEVSLDSLDKKTLEKVAMEVNDFLKAKNKNKQYQDKFIRLVNVEHRRWVVEKITQGWTCLTNYEACLSGVINDKKKKLHPCIVKSNSDFNLAEQYKNISTNKWIKAMWNNPCLEDNSLDDLDMVSLNLHRKFLNEANKIKRTYSVNGEEYQRILSIISENIEAQLAFDEWILCVKKIWNDDEYQAKLYDSYKEKFEKSINVLDKIKKDEILKYVSIIDLKAKPVLLAFKYRDYKASDADLIKNIPFILTYRENISLLVPLMTGDNTERFNNVASSTLLNPDKVTYLCYLRTAADIENTKDTIKYIISYMNRKSIKSKIYLWLIYSEKSTEVRKKISDLKNTFKEADYSCKVKSTKDFSVVEESEIAERLNEYINNVDVFEKNTAYLSALLKGAGYYGDKSSFKFNSVNKKFEENESCEWLSYIKGGQFFTVSDVISFKNSIGKMNVLPEYADYKNLWNFYKKNQYAWKELCKILEKYSEEKDIIASFNINTDFTNTKTYEFIIPVELRDGYNYVVSQLRDVFNIIGEESRIEYKTTTSCKLTIIVGLNNCGPIKKMLADPYKMRNISDLSFVVKPKKIELVFDNLVVQDMDISKYLDEVSSKKKLYEILQFFQREHYIYNLNNSENTIYSFVYSTKQSKQLLTNAGRVLEIYVYQKLQESGFDDVVSGYEVNWEKTDIKSEFDCILTSGFRSLWIECKLQDKLSQDYYYKLSSLVNQFGINAIPVLVADTNEWVGKDNTANDMQVQRGKMMGVVTVSNKDDITEIDETLRRILNGKY